MTDRPIDVAAFRHAHEAELARGYLSDAGIPAAVLADPAGEIQYGRKFSPGARLLVRQEHLDEARRVLRAAGMLEP